MATHRYWRARGLSGRALSSLELTAFHLYDETTRLDASATLTSNVAPSVGSLANLQDTDINTGALWAAADVQGLKLQWDFGGSPVTVNGFALGSADDSTKFLRYARIEYSDDATTWTVASMAPFPDRTTFQLFAWPGARTMSAFQTASRWSKTDWTPGALTHWSPDQKTFDTVGNTIAGYIRALTPRSSGIRQFEIQRILTTTNPATVGVRVASATDATLGQNALDWGYSNNGQKINNNSAAAYGSSWNAVQIIGVVVNFTTGAITFYRDGVSQGVAYTAAGLIGTEVFPTAGFTHPGVTTDGFILNCETMVYPVAGATAWGGDVIPVRDVWSEETKIEAPRLVLSSGADQPYTGVKYTPLSTARGNYYIGGLGRVYGTVKVDGTPSDVPVHRRVRLYRDRDGMLIQEQWSNATTGAYAFQYIEMDHTYTVITYDYTGTFRAVVADRIVPELMT